MMRCKCSSCKEEAIYLESFCWEHLIQEHRDKYKTKLLESIRSNPSIYGENFQSVAIKDIQFPEFCSFQRCNFLNAHFENVILNRVDFKGSNFSYATLKDCRFNYADCRGIDTLMQNADLRESHFHGAWLQNVDFTNADLRDTILIDADLIGAKLKGTMLYASRLLNTRVRRESFCNFDPKLVGAIRVGDEYTKVDNELVYTPLHARFVYTLLKNNFRSIGEYSDERWARNRERSMERVRLFRLGFLKDRYSDALAIEHWNPEDKYRIFESRISAVLKWFVRWILNYIFGYGETPSRFIVLSAVIIILFSFLFLFLGFEYTLGVNRVVLIDRDISIDSITMPNILDDYKTSLYMSVVTFTTLGYGDAHPIGVTRILAATEALLGFFVYSAFVATFLVRLREQ